MAITITQTTRTKNAHDAVNIVRPLTEGVFADGITLTVVENKVYEMGGFWQVPVVPSHWPARTLPIHEDLVQIEETLRERGVADIVLSLSE